jgi:hypothetical protein
LLLTQYKGASANLAQTRNVWECSKMCSMRPNETLLAPSRPRALICGAHGHANRASLRMMDGPACSGRCELAFPPGGQCLGAPVLQILPMGSRFRAYEKIKTAGSGKTPQRHSRESGNPFLKLEQAVRWVPAFARTTLRHCAEPVLARIIHGLRAPWLVPSGPFRSSPVRPVPAPVSKVLLKQTSAPSSRDPVNNTG